MFRILIVYYSRGGNTRKMAELIARGIKNERVEAEVRDVKDVSADYLLGFDAVVVGSPTYYGSMAADIKKLFDESVAFHGKLDGKIGAAFSSSRQIGGGNETTILDILNAMLIHSMVVQSDWQGDHYGPVAIGFPDAAAQAKCVRAGARLSRLVKRLAGGA